MARNGKQMSTVVTPPAASTENSLIRKTIMTANLEDVLIGKTFTFSPVANAEEASSRIGGDSEKFLKVLNAGLRAIERESASASNDGWFVFGEDGKLSEVSTSGESAGDPTVISALVNNFAKASTPNWSNLTAAEKNAKRDDVRGVFKANPAMLEMLKKSALAASSND